MTPASTNVSSPLRFTDVAAEAGIDFRLGHEGKSPLSVLETAPGGCGWADWDGDGRLDAVAVGPNQVRIYRGQDAGRFKEVTEGCGIAQQGEWMGCAIGDYDADGDPDLLLTGYRCIALYRNRGALRFQEVSREAGLKPDLWTTSGAFADVDGDGNLDLYLCGYLDFQKGQHDLCSLGALQSACGPEHYEPTRGRLYRNTGGGRFVERTAEFGLRGAEGKTWSALFSDINGDRLPDLYLANDQEPCDLFVNTGKGFRSAGAESGVAYDPTGNVMGAMGLDAGDLNGDGDQDLLVTTFYQQPRGLFMSVGEGRFRSAAEDWGLDLPARRYVGFGCCLFDADCDGDLDLFIANGHVRDNIHQFDSGQAYRQPMQLFENRDGTYVEVSASAGSTFADPMVGRGAAAADYDDDGDVDLLVIDLEGSARLLRNDTPRGANRWLKVSLASPAGNREAIGALLELKSPSRSQVREIYRCRSVLSSADTTVHFGLGAEKPTELLVRWPGGSVRRIESPPLEKEINLNLRQ